MKPCWPALILTVLLTPTVFAQTPPTMPAETPASPSVGGQESPPPPAAPRAVTYPTPVERTFANGLRVIAVRRTNVPLISAQLVIKTGSEADPANRAGLAALTADLLTQGTATRSAFDIALATDSLGANLDASAGWDASRVQVSATTPKFERAFTVFADAIRNPAFAPAEIDRAKTKVLSSLQLTYSDPASLARLVANRAIYGDAPYGHPADGTPESVPAITRAELQQFHKAYYRPDNTVLIIGGDLTAEQAFSLAERVFGNWARPTTALPLLRERVERKSGVTAPRIVVVDQPDAGRAAVVIGRMGIARSNPTYYSGVLTNAVLSGYSGRLNSEVRIKRGLSYGASARLEARRDVGPFTASTLVDNTKGAEGAEVMLQTVEGLARAPIDESELKPRKAVVTGSFARSLETIEGLVSQVGALALYGLPLGEINRYINQTEAVGAREVRQFAGDYLGNNFSVVIVGNAKLFADDLRKRFPATEVIPFAQLDLNRAGLKRGSVAQTR